MAIDAVGKKIIALLQQDGRMALINIGENLQTKKKEKYSHVSVRKRLNHLVQEDLIRVQATVNLQKFGVVFGLIMLSVDNPNDIESLIDKYKNCPRVLFLFPTVGHFNLVCGFYAENMQEAESYLNFCSIKNEPGVRLVDLSFSTKNFHPGFFAIHPIGTNDQVISPCSRNCGSCSGYANKTCTGCPRFQGYRGSF